MTMDISHRKNELKNETNQTKAEEQTEIQTVKSTKRSFDVAFLMLPDEKLKEKQIRSSKISSYDIHVTAEENLSLNNNEKCESDEELEVGVNSDSPKHEFSKTKFYPIPKQQIFDDPTLIKVKQDEELQHYRPKALNVSAEQKSAFTKVNVSKETRLSPNLSVSPDLSYQNSLSPSPPIINRNYQNFPAGMLSPNQLFKTQNGGSYHNNFIAENFSSTPANFDSPFGLVKSAQSGEILQPNFSKIRPVLSQYRPDLAYNYPQFPSQDVLKMGQPELKFPPDIRNPAAAILTSLLPPSLAALSLPAQNVCAKCNITFRMTSDLVYHMRSHHKNDAADPTKKRREDKLKCPVCAESFRERHHLTRHMTAHQDKDNDVEEPEVKKKVLANYAK